MDSDEGDIETSQQEEEKDEDVLNNNNDEDESSKMNDGDQKKDSDQQQQDTKKSSIMRILVATDNHLGYLEKDPIRGDDSFNSFEEILQYAHKLKVDMVLLGGDLFHDNKPSRSCLYRTMELFRKYCLGDTPIKLQFLSDQAVNFFNKFHTVNYEDPNFNISLPVFSIHGNHDDPTGEGGLAALDLLSVSNLVNYFGKTENIDDITIYPLLIGKGETKIAIYGLGNIRDERLYRTFQKQQVKLMKPIESKGEWFNILVLHQNRVAHNPKNYVHEQMIDNFIDFVLWGHEHECLINPQPSSIGEFHITQPGSSVATALSEGESKEKFVGLLEVYKNQFRFKPYPLNTIRPFVLDTITLADSKINPTENEEIATFLENKVEAMIIMAKEKAAGKPSENLLPLIRLKVDYTGYSTINPQKFGQRFTGKVANPNDILLFTRKKPTSSKKQQQDVFDSEKTKPDDKIKVEDFISEFLGNTPADRLNILSETDLHFALHNFVDKDESDAISNLVNLSISKSSQFLKRNVATKDAHHDHIVKTIEENLPINCISGNDQITNPSNSTTSTSTTSTPSSTQKSSTQQQRGGLQMSPPPMPFDPDAFEGNEDDEEDSHRDHHHHGADDHGDQSSSEDELFNSNMFKTPDPPKSKKTPASKKSATPKTPSSTTSSPRTPYRSPVGSQVISLDDSDDEDGSDQDKTKKKRAKKADPSPNSYAKKKSKQ
ncbi:DNA repair exonuclease [Cavenderia fasciculata]|uniref:Double-strand break repair protein n=1 Tax=Cavenderia fasciculata TaxID=261658 RepID=F4QBF7_CACFS|nr:DNA repair exonuclease [Cavenderia fasciculata]EGG14929.1 DNA repair exonuclease [Cavenderia fasciculata]|eukprot:XP_004351445.1 DNA repair exonuclease [Cavenderia fasciculata]